MYFPIFRGKKYELMVLKECKKQIASTNVVVPIIEPVKQNTSDLDRCIKELNDSNIQHILTCNPDCGEFSKNTRQLYSFVEALSKNSPCTEFAYWVHEGTSLDEIELFLSKIEKRKFHFIHKSAHAAPAELISRSHLPNFGTHIFISDSSSRRYQKQFSQFNRVLIQDTFSKLKRNADYINQPDEFFSDQHLTYNDDGLYGFGDFSIVGDNYSESGGPAYTVAIHFVYENTGSEIWVRHFLSQTNTTDPHLSSMIVEALEDMIEFLNANQNISDYSTASTELKDICQLGKATNLAYIKKLSIKHHIELMIHLLTRG